MLGNASAFNSHNPFAGAEPSYDSTQYNGQIGGPLGKVASFFFNVERRNIADIDAINAFILDQNFKPIQTFESIPNPRYRTNIAPRFDYAVSKNNTLTARYQYYRDTQNNEGPGQLTLATQAYNEQSSEHTFQIGDTQIIGAKVSLTKRAFNTFASSAVKTRSAPDPTINVRGAFEERGLYNQGTITDHQNHYEFQNYTSLIHGNHTLKFGARVRALRDANFSRSDFNGTFTFSSLDGTTDLNCHSPSDPNMLPAATPCPVSYQYAEQHRSGGIAPATQLSITAGTPNANLTTYDAGLYLQDDWRVRPNLTLSYGLRFETQNDIHDRGDWAPRLGFAWGVGGRSARRKP